MGQKINATGLRLKKKLNWNSLFCTHNLQNYSKVMIETSQTGSATDLLLSKIHFYPNNLTITRDSKTSRISSKLVQKQQIFKGMLSYQQQVSARAQSLFAATSAVKQLYLTKNNAHYQFSKLLLNQKAPGKKKFKQASLKTNKVTFSLLSPKLITAHISALLEKKAKSLLGFNTSNLSISIPLVLTRLLKPFKKALLGVKIICSGKWKKTRSGRKQKLCIKYGRVRNPSISNVIRFHSTTQTTKFGACGIKVWISHKKIARPARLTTLLA